MRGRNQLNLVHKRPLLLAAVVPVIIMMLLGLVFVPANAGAEESNATPITEEVRSLLDTYYVEEINWTEIDETSMEKLFESLGDPYTDYLNLKEFDDFLIHLGSSFGGIGVYVEQVEGYITIIAPMEDTPAYEAGLKPRDRIIKVDKLDVVGVPLEQGVNLIKGEPGTAVELTILREGQELNFTITRDMINPKSVAGELMDDQLGYVKLSAFGENTMMELMEVMADLESQGALGYLLDLRYNGGGFLDSAINVAEIFVPEGTIVHVVDRFNNRETFSTSGNGLEKPLVVLVNEGSASASEILAAAIKENGAGVLVGMTTFGKASVQGIVELNDGAVLKMTIAHYLTPEGSNINGTGLIPDVQVEGNEEQLKRAKEILQEKVSKEDTKVLTTVVTLFIGKQEGIVNGQQVLISEVPFIYDSRTYVPLRFVSENLGLAVEWDEDTKEISLFQDDKTISMRPGSNQAFVDDEEYVFEAPLLLEDGHSYIPIRFLIELIGGEVDWVQETKQVDITK